MDIGNISFGKRLAMTAGSRLGNRARFIAQFERLVRITERPQNRSQGRSRVYPYVAAERGELPMALRIVKGNCRFKMLPGSKKIVHLGSSPAMRARKQNISCGDVRQK